MSKNLKIMQVREILESSFNTSNQAKLNNLYKEIIREDGYLNSKVNLYYDIGREGFVTVNRESGKVTVYSSKNSLYSLIRANYKGVTDIGKILNLVPTVALIFDPKNINSEKRVTDENIRIVNTYKPSKFILYMEKNKIEKINHDNFPNIYLLLKNLFRKDEYIHYFENWLAWGLQFREKNGVAIISKGIEGAGKGVFYKYIIKYAYGEEYCATLDNEAIRSNFNGLIENKLFLIMNEVKPDFRDFSTVHERLKAYITDEEFIIEEKHVKTKVGKSYFNAWLHTNHSVPLHISPTDRRYTIIDTANIPLKAIIDTFELVEKIKEERDEYIKNIMSLKVDRNLATTPLKTPEKDRVINATQNRLETLANMIKYGEIKGLVTVVSECHSSEIIIKQFEQEITEQINKKVISNKNLNLLYKCFIDEDASNMRIAKAWDMHFRRGAKIKKERARYVV